MELACLDGALVPLAEARIPITDPGLLRGDGVFEVVRLYGGRPYALDEHLARMTTSAANMRVPFSAEDVESDVRALLEASEPGDGQLRIVVTRSGTRFVLREPVPSYPPTISLGYVTYAPPRILDGVKSLSYGGNMLATRLAQERGFDEALLVTPHGRVLEGPTSSLFVVLGGRLVTPPLDDHLLDSITRRRVLEVTGAVERPVTTDELRGASGAALASTTREVQPVHHIEDIELDVNDALIQDAVKRTREAIAGA